MDSDDWMPPDSIEKLVTAIEHDNSDFVCGSYSSVHSFFYTKQFIRKDATYKVSDSNELSDFLPPSWITLWAKLYKSEIIQQNDLKFRLKYSEDTEFVLRYLQYCNIVSTISPNVYYWSILRGQSASRSYHGELNRCEAVSQELRLSLFGTGELPIKEQISVILMFFYNDIINYVANAPTREEAVAKIEETHELFRDALTRLNKQQLLEYEKEGDIARFFRYKELLDEKKYGEVYDRFSAEIEKGKRSSYGIKRSIAHFLRPLSRFFVYKLKWFYRK